jgi:hypothetical protein
MMKLNDLLTRDELKRYAGIMTVMNNICIQVRQYEAAAKTNPGKAAQAMFSAKIAELNTKYNTAAERAAEYQALARSRYEGE